MFTSSKRHHKLRHAPRLWYERLGEFLIKKGFTRGKIDPTLFTYDITFRSINNSTCKWFSRTYAR